jgi:kynurenine formamidase
MSKYAMSLWNAVASMDAEFIDLSIGLEPDASEPFPPEIEYWDHETGAELLAGNLNDLGYEGIEGSDFPDAMGLAWEELTLIPHAGTHLDAPWHYGPEVDGEPARTIDEIPLEWCAGNAVVLDFTWKEPRTEISAEELGAQLEELDHELSAGEIVLIETGADELWGTEEYTLEFPGMGAEGTKYLVEQGVKVIGTDAYGFDKPFAEMGRRYAESGDDAELWPAHFAGREVEYCQIESMANLDELPRRTDVPLVTFPISVERASAGWVRPVAILEGEE